MSVYVSTWVWERSKAREGDLLVLLAIADIADKQGRAWPSIPTIARMARLSVRQTIRIVQRLERTNEITVNRNGGPRGTHLYQVIMNGLLDFDDLRRGDTQDTPDKMSPPDIEGGEGVTLKAKRGDIAVSPEPLTVSKPPRAPEWAPPDWIPKESWEGYEAMRIKAKKPMTDRARAMVVKRLTAMKAAGEDVVAVLEQSERNCWTDVYPVKPEGQQAKATGWWSTDSGIVDQARKLGIDTIGKTAPDLRAKINEKMGHH